MNVDKLSKHELHLILFEKGLGFVTGHAGSPFTKLLVQTKDKGFEANGVTAVMAGNLQWGLPDVPSVTRVEPEADGRLSPETVHLCCDVGTV
jgi:hypothetical protein